MLDVAAAEVVARGWKGLQMQTVAAHVGVSRQTLYNAFTNKHGLARALVLRLTERFLDGVEHALTSRDEVYDRWLAAIRYTLDTAAADPLLTAVLTGDASAEFPPPAHQRRGPRRRRRPGPPQCRAAAGATRPRRRLDRRRRRVRHPAGDQSTSCCPCTPPSRRPSRSPHLVERYLAPSPPAS